MTALSLWRSFEHGVANGGSEPRMPISASCANVCTAEKSEDFDLYVTTVLNGPEVRGNLGSTRRQAMETLSNSCGWLAQSSAISSCRGDI